MEMLEKHRLVEEEEEVTRIGASKCYTISFQNMEKEFLLSIELFPVWLPLVMQQNTSLILSYFCFPLETLEMRAHMRIKRIKHKNTHIQRET